MKKMAVMLTALVLWGLWALPGLGEAAIPDPIRLKMAEEGWELEAVTDTLSMEDGNGKARFVSVNRNGFLVAYRLEEDGWQRWWEMRRFYATDTRFQRHRAGALRADGTSWADDLGFDIVSDALDARISYHWDGEDLSVAGWRDENAWPGETVVRKDAVIFCPDGQGERVEISIGEELYALLRRGDFDSMAKTPDALRARAAIGKAGAAALMPGWTIGYYDMYNDGENASVCYYRIAEGNLSILRVTLSSDHPLQMPMEALAVPLSPALLARLEQGSFDDFIDVTGHGSTFLTEDAFDRQIIPITGAILENDVQRHSLVALTEEAGVRRVAVAEKDAEGNWQVKTTNPLPRDTSLDLFHEGDGGVSLEWDGQKMQCAFGRTSDGQWRLKWVMGRDDYAVSWYGLRMDGDGGDTRVYGTFRESDLFSFDPRRLPASGQEALQAVDSAGWAVVHNPDPGDRLHLRAKPDRQADSLGKFYNGTPLRVLETRGEWCRVRLGEGQTMEGWMMKKYLSFGAEMQRVDSAFPDLIVRDEMIGMLPCLDAARSAVGTPPRSAIPLTGWEIIIGTLEFSGSKRQNYWIVMNDRGDIAYVPQAWFWEGNG